MFTTRGRPDAECPADGSFLIVRKQRVDGGGSDKLVSSGSGHGLGAGATIVAGTTATTFVVRRVVSDEHGFVVVVVPDRFVPTPRR